MGHLLRPRVLPGLGRRHRAGRLHQQRRLQQLPGRPASPPSFSRTGFPQDFTPPPFIQSDYRNGQGILYRPLDGNERPRSQQWNLTVDREIDKGFMVGLAYVGSRGSHLPSNNHPLNALDPALLSLRHKSSTTSSSRARPRCTACPSPIPAGASR